VQQKRSTAPLGSDLRNARLEASLTQATLATRLGISLPTLRHAECARGALSGFIAIAAHLGKEISGRSLPPGDCLRHRLARLRERREISQRQLARIAGISPTSVAVSSLAILTPLRGNFASNTDPL